MRRVTHFGLCVLVGCAIYMLAGCGGQGKNGNATGVTETGVNVEFWHYFSKDQETALKELLKQFETANPSIKVKAVFQSNPRELRQKLDGSFAASPSKNPVLSTLYESWTDDYLSRGLMDPVQGYFGGSDGLSTEEQDDIVKVFREGNSWDGKMVTMPFNKSIYLYYLNMDRLGAAGFTTAPKTQTEYAAAVQKCTLREDGRIKMYGLGIQPRSEGLTTLLFARGGRYTDDSGKITLATPEAVASLALLKSLQSPEKNLYINPDFLSVPFTNQQIAMYIYSSASLPYNSQGSAGKFKYEAAPVPAGDGAEPRYLIQGTNIGIFRNHPEVVRQAAWKLVKFLTSTKNSAYFETRSGYMPIRYSILKDPQMAQHLAKNPDYAVAASLVLSDKGRQEPRFAAWEGVRADLDSLVDTVLSKGTDPKQALDELQAKVDAKLGKGK